MGGRSVLVIYKDGKIVYNEAVNEMNARHKLTIKMLAGSQKQEPDLSDFSSNSRIPIASCSKWLSAALVMTFVDEGSLNLDDSIGKFLPVMTANGKGAITISQCLSHLTAIKSPSLRASLNEIMSASSMDEAIETIAKSPMEGTPGKVFRYSNNGLQIAAAVIEKISGKDFETLFKERIAEPLDMTQTDFKNGKVVLPAGGANSSPSDYINFLAMILNKGEFNGKLILSPQSVAEMQIDRINSDVTISYSPAEAAGTGYGFGEWIMMEAVSSPGLFGSLPIVDNNNGYAAILMTLYLGSSGKQQRYQQLKDLMDNFAKTL